MDEATSEKARRGRRPKVNAGSVLARCVDALAQLANDAERARVLAALQAYVRAGTGVGHGDT